jgi:excisionase family DNA binding protein
MSTNAVLANPPQNEKPRGAASRLVRAKVAAAETGIPYTSLRDLAFRGEIPVIKVGKAWYFDRRDLENWIATRKERLK